MDDYIDTTNGERISEYDLEEIYRESLDDTYGPIKIGELTYMPSEVLEQCDPTAFRCGFSDWIDASDFVHELDWDGDDGEDDE